MCMFSLFSVSALLPFSQTNKDVLLASLTTSRAEVVAISQELLPTVTKKHKEGRRRRRRRGGGGGRRNLSLFLSRTGF
jgi:hypothetical protein